MTFEALHPLHRVDQTGFLGFGDMAGRMAVGRVLSYRLPVLRTPILAQPLLPDALQSCSFFRGHRRPTTLITSQEHLPLRFDRCGADAAWAFPGEALSEGPCSREKGTPAGALDSAGSV